MKNVKERRLMHLLRKMRFPIEGIVSVYNDTVHYKKTYSEVLRLQCDLNLSIEQVILMGQTQREEKRLARAQMNRKPTQIRKDNKTVRVGSGGSNRNKIRRPRKVRKTAWKRFYKLFPNENPDNE